MGGEIANLKSAINGGSSTLASLLENNDIYTQFSITAVGEYPKTPQMGQTLGPFWGHRTSPMN